MSTKHLINKKEDAVLEGLHGLAYLNPAIEIDDASKIVYLKKIESSRVSIVSGGGSGHEPSHSAMCGEGLLTAAVCGPPFASPTSRQITNALKRTAVGTKGCLLVVKQYTGDVMHFGLAKERFAATDPEDAKRVRLLIVGDDVAVGRKAGAMVGRRGLAGTCLVYKVAGAMAAQGASIDDIYDAASYVAKNTATIGASLEHCHVPGSEEKDKKLKADEMEIGMGIHNEPGNRTANVTSANKLVSDLMHQLTSTSNSDRAFVPFKLDGTDEVVLLVNNLGGLPELELSIILREAGKWLHDSHFRVVRALAGTFMTSFAMPGVSLSLVRLPRRGEDNVDRDTIIDALDAKCGAPGWKWSSGKEPSTDEFKKADEKEKSKPPSVEKEEERGPAPSDKKLFEEAIISACKSLIDAESEITHYDSELGDGDAGATLKAGAQGVLKGLNDLTIRVNNLSQTFVQISAVTEEEMGGTSGALYSIFLSALASSFATQKGDVADPQTFANALEHALNTLYGYTKARPPSKTLVDVLAAFVGTLAYEPEEWHKAFDAAEEAAEATKYLDATLGRSAYVGKEKVSKDIPDAGAWGLFKLLDGVKRVLVPATKK